MFSSSHSVLSIFKREGERVGKKNNMHVDCVEPDHVFPKFIRSSRESRSSARAPHLPERSRKAQSLVVFFRASSEDLSIFLSYLRIVCRLTLHTTLWVYSINCKQTRFAFETSRRIIQLLRDGKLFTNSMKLINYAIMFWKESCFELNVRLNERSKAFDVKTGRKWVVFVWTCREFPPEWVKLELWNSFQSELYKVQSEDDS